MVEAATVSVTKQCLIGQPCTVNPSPPIAFTIIGTPKIITWSANYTGSGTQGNDFYITTDLSQLNQIPLSTNLTPGFNTGTRTLTAGTYYISITYFAMGPGNYTIEYNPASTGDPHITTINGARYDFQAAGEFILLRQPKDLEIQVRHTPVSTKGATCVSINTAVAAKVGSHRVTYQPNLNGEPDPGGLQLRIDGTLVDPNEGRIDLDNHGYITRTNAPGGLRIVFPDGSYLIITPGWWADQGKWYLNLDIAPAGEGSGIAGAIERDAWLPALPDGSSMGPLPNSPHERHVNLNQKFADSWRVTDENSLFDYAPGTSTSTFTNRNWPPEQPPCDIPGTAPAEPITENLAKVLCLGVNGGEYDNCVFDVMVTGNPGFAATYALSQRVVADAVRETIIPSCEPNQSKLKWILLGSLLGLVIALMIFLLWRNRT